MSAATALRIGEVARRCGTTPRTIRYYEEIGLLPAGRREPGSHRLYGEGDVERLRELLRLKDLLGVTLEELGEIATAESARAALRREWRENEPEPARRAAILEEARAHLDRQLELVRRRRTELERFERDLLARRRRIGERRRELARETGGPAPFRGSGGAAPVGS
ncbi:MAG: MerR family transcriptional regulator [Solirubrobacterales bacterium]|mgnify:CR=1 FL=1